jgi:hypothetical protein
MTLKHLKMILLNILEINTISQRHFFKLKIKYKIYYAICANIQANKKLKTRKEKSQKL